VYQTAVHALLWPTRGRFLDVAPQNTDGGLSTKDVPAQQAHATDRCAHEIIAFLTVILALAAADAQSVGLH